MRLHTFHRGASSWAQPTNHLDGRRCPTCKTTVHGDDAQQQHYDRHLDEQEFQRRVIGWIVELAKHVGITEEQVDLSFGKSWEWGAKVTGTEDEIEAAE